MKAHVRTAAAAAGCFAGRMIGKREALKYSFASYRDMAAAAPDKSDYCINNEHGSCEGIIRRQVVTGSGVKDIGSKLSPSPSSLPPTSTATTTTTTSAATTTRMCTCPCHNSMYQLVRNTIALVNRDQRTNPYYTYSHEDD